MVKKGKGTKCMVVFDSQGIPLGSTLDSASLSEVKLAEETLKAVNVSRIGSAVPKSDLKDLLFAELMTAIYFENGLRN
jgi:hypothetical protein